MPMSTSLAPGYLRMTYSGTLFPHHMTIPVQYVLSPTPGEEPDLVLKDESTLGAVAALDAFVTLLQPFFHSTTKFGLAEAHTVDATTGEDQFIYAWDVNKLGTGTDANIPTSQNVMTLKSNLGTLYRLYMMEGNTPVNQKSFPTFPSYVGDMADYLTGATSFVYARGNAFLFSAISQVSKFNDSLRKQQGLA